MKIKIITGEGKVTEFDNVEHIMVYNDAHTDLFT